MHTSIKRSLFIAAGVAALLNAPCAKAQALYQFVVNTAPLESATEAPFYLDFQFNNGSTTSNNDNVVTLSNFSFGSGGSATAGTKGTNITGPGSITGDLGSSVTINDGEGAGINEFYEAFTPGSTLTFEASIPTVGQPGVNPEGFFFAIQDQSDANIATTDPSGENNLAEATLPTEGSLQTLTMNTYQSTGGSEFSGDTTHPDEVGVTAAVPEPSTYAGLGLGIVALLAFGRKARRARS
jgi:hypothetical protein